MIGNVDSSEVPDMAGRAGLIAPLTYVSCGKDTKQAALYNAFCEAISSQAIAPGQKLPSTRDLARTHRVSRGIAVAVYESLAVRGYVVTRRGSGTFAVLRPPGARLANRGRGLDAHVVSAKSPEIYVKELSRLGQQFASMPLPTAMPLHIPFAPYRPALDNFPSDLWAKLYAKHARTAHPNNLVDGHPAGTPELRRAIATYLEKTRGIKCQDAQIIITSSNRHSLYFSAQILTDPEDRALIEEPGSPWALAALRAARLSIVPAAVDGQGMRIDAISCACESPRFVYVTPAHQCPTGVVMSDERRQQVIGWAERKGVWIFEDDCDSDIRYDGVPSPALYALNGGGRVLHAGGFSKTLFPALRIGYLVVPRPLVDVFMRAQALYGQHPPVLPQMVLCDFIESGHFARHVEKTVVFCRERRDALLDALNRRFGGSIDVPPAHVGLEIMVRWGAGKDADVIAAAAAARGLLIYPISHFRVQNAMPSGAVLGFAAFETAALRNAVASLAEVVETCGT